MRARSRVTIIVEFGGKKLIRVEDDGSGWIRDDARLCLERHATSKIRRADDLGAISTLGFRGEACRASRRYLTSGCAGGCAAHRAALKFASTEERLSRWSRQEVPKAR